MATAFAALVTGGGALAVSHAGTATGTVTITDQGIRVAGVAAGKVTLVVKNTGKASHQLVVLRTSIAPLKLTMAGTRAGEVGRVGGTARIAPGKATNLTLTLQPGKYVFLSNLPGDYKRGLVRGVTLQGSATTPPQESSIDVSAFEMGFKASKTTVPHGTVTFKVHNDGKVAHDFSFGSKGGGTRLLEPGQSATLTVTFANPGKYTFICTVEGHYAAGMSGVLTVG
jgi:uncharacterized cupredoxin-like copper-binding protein